MSLEGKLITELKSRGADFVYFTDISALSVNQNQGYGSAILILKVLSPEFIRNVSVTPDYVNGLIRSGEIEKDEFTLTEEKTDALADFLADYLQQKGFKAYSQSEKNVYASGSYNEKTRSTPLPHKAIALRAGLGWIGKHDLLVSDIFGSAISMSSVLTNANFSTNAHSPAVTLCGLCEVCKDVCPEHAIHGVLWKPGIHRDELIDVKKCTTCLKCLVHCPYTQNYMTQNSDHKYQ